LRFRNIKLEFFLNFAFDVPKLQILRVIVDIKMIFSGFLIEDSYYNASCKVVSWNSQKTSINFVTTTKSYQTALKSNAYLVHRNNKLFSKL